MKFLTLLIQPTTIKRRNSILLVVVGCFIFGISNPSFSQQNIKTKFGSRLSLANLNGIYSTANPASLNNKITEEDLFPPYFPLDKRMFKEDVNKRTLKTRTFTSEEGNYYIQYSRRSINYLDENKKLQPINAKLRFSGNGWSAPHQACPAYLNTDGSTAMSSDNKKIGFNKNSKINGKEINVANYTVGEDGMSIKDVIPNVDKRIVFYENVIETDYLINKPINNNNQDLVISEEIEIPSGYVIKKDLELKRLVNGQERQVDNNKADEYVVYAPGNKEKARFITPVYYDADNNMIFGKYTLTKKEEKNVLEMTVPSAWLQDSLRKYPITLDPIVYGDTVYDDSSFMSSCQFPNFSSSDSILVVIPPNITITNFYVEDSYYTSPLSNPQAFVEDGTMRLSTSCGAVQFQCAPVLPVDSSGYCYLVPHSDLRTDLACCFAPSCVQQTFWLKHSLARNSMYGPGCNQTFVYYSPVNPLFSFSASIVGHTVETSQAQWFVYPSPICSDSCNIKLRVITNYGVPPYTITHPWFVGSDNYGTWGSAVCTSTGKDTIILTIPGCPTSCGATTTLSVPPPTIVDVCGNTVLGLTPKTITVNPVPDAVASNVNVCAGTPINITVSSCIGAATFVWSGSDASAGTGNIVDNNSVPGTINFTIVPTNAGCVGASTVVTATVSPQANANIVSSNMIICTGQSVTLTGSGGAAFQWSGGSNSTLATITVSPTITTVYYLQASNGGCNDLDSVTIEVDNFTPPVITGNLSICVGDNTVLTATGGTSYIWSGGSNANTASITVSPIITTPYYVTTSNACGTASDTAVVVVNPDPILSITSTSTVIQDGGNSQLNVTGGVSYVWNGGADLSCTNCANPVASPAVTTTFTVTGTDANGCTSTDTVTVFVSQGIDELYVPNTITPNEDGTNDVFYVYGINIKQITMRVFDRWGELIYESMDKDKGWDGTFNGNYVQFGVYVYTLQCDWNDGRSERRIGNVNVVY